MADLNEIEELRAENARLKQSINDLSALISSYIDNTHKMKDVITEIMGVINSLGYTEVIVDDDYILAKIPFSNRTIKIKKHVISNDNK